MSVFLVVGGLVAIIMISLGICWIFYMLDELDENKLNMEKYKDWSDKSQSIIITGVGACAILFGIGIAVFFVTLETNKV